MYKWTLHLWHDQNIPTARAASTRCGWDFYIPFLFLSVRAARGEEAFSNLLMFSARGIFSLEPTQPFSALRQALYMLCVLNDCETQ
jgi:hypothetical protein